jgi:hypothetical protein
MENFRLHISSDADPPTSKRTTAEKLRIPINVIKVEQILSCCSSHFPRSKERYQCPSFIASFLLPGIAEQWIID